MTTKLEKAIRHLNNHFKDLAHSHTTLKAWQVVLDELPDENYIVDGWSVADVTTTLVDEMGLPADTLTLEEKREVLQRVARKHDATIGINWEVIEFHINDMFPEAIALAEANVKIEEDEQ